MRNYVLEQHKYAHVCNPALDKVLYQEITVCFHLENPRQLCINCHNYHLEPVFSQLHHLKCAWLSVTSNSNSSSSIYALNSKLPYLSTSYGIGLLLLHTSQRQQSTSGVTLVQLTSGRSRHSFSPIYDVPGIDACVYVVVKKRNRFHVYVMQWPVGLQKKWRESFKRSTLKVIESN